MATREDLYRQFGPKLIEAIVLILKDEINILRVQAGLAARDNEQIIAAVDTKLKDMINYDWMNN